MLRFAMSMRPLLPLVLLCLSIASPAFSQISTGPDPPPSDPEAIRLSKVINAVRINEAILIDGYLRESAWDLADPATDFIQLFPDTGVPTTADSDVRFLYDEDNLYVGWIAYDSMIAEIGVNDLREDFGYFENDGVTVLLDSLNDRRSAFVFGTNPEGAKRDSQVTNNGQQNPDWDGVWDVQVSKNAEGWISEFVIPFKTLRFSSASMQEWGLQLNRRVVRLNEENTWTPIPTRYSALRISLAGTMRGIENNKQGLNLRVEPFVVAGMTDRRSTPDADLETVRSFSRIEDYDGGLDAKYSITPQLTLDLTYRTEFAQVEVDQQQVNLTRFNLFFPEKRDFFLENAGTFNFGPGGNLVPFFSRRIGLNDSGTPVPIVGGTRVSGKVGQFDVGFLGMKTERVGRSGEPGYTPSNNYGVARIKRNFLENSWIGALTTHRDSTIEADINRVFGADAHFEFYRRLEFDTYILRSDTPNLSGQNLARRFQSGWRDDEVSFGAEYNEVQSNFNPEVGFVRRRDNRHYAGDFTFRPFLESSDLIRNLTFASKVDYFGGSDSGKVETRIQEVTIGVTFLNRSSASLDVTRTFDRLTQPTDIQGVPILEGDYTYVSYSASANTNQGRRLSGTANVVWGEFWDGDRKSFGGSMIWRRNQHLSVEFDYSHNRANLSGGKFTTDLMGARFLYAFNPRAFLNAFIQYNAANHEVSSNIRFNLIHRPLSDLYLVYNDRRDTDSGVLMERAIIIKFTNLFSF